MSEWKEYKLGEVCDVRDGTHDSPKANFEGYPLVTSKNIKDGKVDLSNTYLISEDDYKNVNQRSKVERWDILYSMIGTIGECAIVKDVPGFAIKNVGLFKTNGNKLLAQWIYYYLKSTEALKELDGRIKGSTQQYISLTDLREFPIIIPPNDEQERITGVLSSLDDKIDLLHRENATLEALAETLFHHYFIENPNPEWKKGKVSDIAIHCKDSTNPQKHSNEIFLHYSIPAYDNGKRPTEEQGQSIQSNKYVIPQNCILFSKLNPHKDKRVWLILDDVQPNTICSTEFQIVKPQNNQWLYFLYEWLIYKENYDEIASGVSGTSGSHQRIDPKVIFENGCPIVDEFTLEQYNTKVKPIFEKIKSNQQRIETLVIQRDMLLPRLMSGEVKIIEQ